MKDSKAKSSGLIVIAEDGKVVLTAGIGVDPRLQALAADPTWLETARAQRQFVLEMDRRRFAGIVLPCNDGDLVVVGEALDTVFEFIATVDFAHDILNHLLNDPFNALTVVDANGRVAFISPVHEAFFGLRRGEANGRPVRDVIQNTRLDKVVRSGRAEIGALQKMKGAERVVSRVPILRQGKVVGAIGRVMFKGPEQVEALSRRVNALEREVEFYRREAATLRRRSEGLEVILGDSPAIRALRSRIAKAAPLDMPVLVTGESGTGKELVAHSLHRLSDRRDAPMVTVNAAALPASLVESELFGYEPGSFTGADRKGRKGKFEQADKGTIFLDEIGDMPMEVQAKLLRVVQDRQIERVGGARARQVDFRLISATNRDLEALVREGSFRLDLYYRISPIVIEVPSLAERREDIPLLVRKFLHDVADRHGRPEPEVAPGALEFLASCDWPGNVRQLRHAVERAFVFAEGAITEESFLDDRAGHHDPTPSAFSHAPTVPRSQTGVMKDQLGRMERDLILDALRRLNGNKKRVAKELGISRSYLYKRLGDLQA